MAINVPRTWGVGISSCKRCVTQARVCDIGVRHQKINSILLRAYQNLICLHIDYNVITKYHVA